jgi:hypothetical protein
LKLEDQEGCAPAGPWRLPGKAPTESLEGVVLGHRRGAEKVVAPPQGVKASKGEAAVDQEAKIQLLSSRGPFRGSQGTPRSYADVVRCNLRSLGVDQSSAFPPASWRRRVSFQSLPSLISFRSDDAPSDLLGQPLKPALGSLLAPIRPIIKGGPNTLRGLIKAERDESSILYGWDGALLLGAQEEGDVRPWQLVRKKFRWKEKNASHAQTQRTSSPLQRGAAWFQRVARGRCFNYLARDHIKIFCRDLPQCLRCGRSGHLSFRCRERPNQKATFPSHKLSAPAFPKSQRAQNSLVKTLSQNPGDPPLQVPQVASFRNEEMERRLSLGSATYEPRREHDRALPELDSGRARVVDFPGNPRMRPRVAMRMAWASDDVQ